jgi:hypothetical protein
MFILENPIIAVIASTEASGCSLNQSMNVDYNRDIVFATM